MGFINYPHFLLGKIGFVGSGIQYLSSQIFSKSSKNWFEKRTAGGTTKLKECTDYQLVTVHSFLFGATLVEHFGNLLHKS